MASVLVELLSSVAPEAASIIEKLQKAKLNQNQTLTALLALNLQQQHVTSVILEQTKENCQAIRDTRADICDLKGILTRKGQT